MAPQAAATFPDGRTAQARWVHRGDAAAAVLLPACGAALAWAGWLIAGSGRSGAPLPWHSYSDLLGLAAAAAGLLILAWWGLGLLLAGAGILLHHTGHARMAAAAFAASPAFLRRLLAAVLGLHLLAAPAANAAVLTSGTGSDAPAVPAASAPDSGPADPYFTVPDRTTAGRAAVEVDPSWQPAAPAPSPGLAAGRAPGPGRQPGPAAVVVRAGDTLWDIAARDLGSLATDAEVAGHWPRWYAANRAVIGADPAVLLPGQILTPPSKR